MKIVEKKCPNCGASLEFNYGDKDIKCKYCGSKFSVEGYQSNIREDNFNIDDLNLVKATKIAFGIHTVIFVIIFIIAFSIIGFVCFNIFTFNKKVDSPSINEPNITIKTSNLKSLKDIKETDTEKLKSKSMSEINKWNKTDEKLTLESSKQLGYYLAVGKSFSTLYDVYELTYKYDGRVYIVYTGVEFSRVTYKDNKLNIGSTNIHGSVVSTGWRSVWGYNSIEDLYNDIDTPLGEEIIASSGLYTN